MKRALLTLATLVSLASTASAGGQTSARRPAKKKVRGAVEHVGGDGTVLRRTVVLAEDGGQRTSLRPDLGKRSRNAAAKGFELEDGGAAYVDADREGALSLGGALELDTARAVRGVTLVKLRHPTRGGEQAAEIRVLRRGRRVIARRKKSDTAATATTPVEAQSAAAAPAPAARTFSHTVASPFGAVEMWADRADPRLIRFRSADGHDVWISVDALNTAARNIGKDVVQNAMTGGSDGLVLTYHSPSLTLIYTHGGREGQIDNQAVRSFLDAYNTWKNAP